jgi:hypothetical protein
MAAPNILGLSSITARTQGVGIQTTSSVGILTASVNMVIKINTFRVTNNSTSSSTNFNVFYRDALSNNIGIASNFTIPVGGTVIIIDKDSSTYVEENCSINVSVADTTRLSVLVSYEELS